MPRLTPPLALAAALLLAGCTHDDRIGSLSVREGNLWYSSPTNVTLELIFQNHGTTNATSLAFELVAVSNDFGGDPNQSDSGRIRYQGQWSERPWPTHLFNETDVIEPGQTWIVTVETIFDDIVTAHDGKFYWRTHGDYRQDNASKHLAYQIPCHNSDLRPIGPYCSRVEG